ncbi:MAG: FAD-binding protein, partial [Atopobiaceae bacterium]|nr:FAD-binding protein [Atopobiaceae bacterium]
DDSCGAAHGIALAHGCELVNAEFLQMMPGLVSPVAGVVVNEKALRFSTVGMDPEVLDERSGYGPFTSRLPSSEFDLAVAAAGPDGLPLSFDLPAGTDELVTDYFDWLRSSFGIHPEDEVRVALFAHASNGGIRIAPDASCVGGPAGLFAGGECTGGIHGADRIGGLASAAALVFGRIAGRSAAAEAGRGHEMPTAVQVPWGWSPEAYRALASLRCEMTAHAMVARTEEGLSSALGRADDLRRDLGETLSPTTDAQQAALTRRTSLQLASARAMLGAMLARRESRGSHHRADHPGEGPAMARQAGAGLQST